MSALPALPGGIDWRGHVESLPLPMWVGAPDGGNLYVNDAYCRLLGVTRRMLVSDWRWADHVIQEERDAYVAAWRDFVNGKKKRFEEVIYWRRPVDGQLVRVAVKAQRLAGGEFQGWLRRATHENTLERLEELADD